MGHEYGFVFILISNYQSGSSFRMAEKNKKSNFMNHVTHNNKE